MSLIKRGNFLCEKVSLALHCTTAQAKAIIYHRLSEVRLHKSDVNFPLIFSLEHKPRSTKYELTIANQASYDSLDEYFEVMKDKERNIGDLSKYSPVNENWLTR